MTTSDDWDDGTVNHSASKSWNSGRPDHARIIELILSWRRDTMHLSVTRRALASPEAQELIDIGMPAVPFLLELLNEYGSDPHVIALLQAITGERPAQFATTVREASNIWVQWGYQNFLLPLPAYIGNIDFSVNFDIDDTIDV